MFTVRTGLNVRALSNLTKTLVSEFGPEQPEMKDSQYAWGKASRASERHPEWNEDATLLAPEQGVFAVFDGMGGEAGGREASAAAVETMQQLLKSWPSKLTPEQRGAHLQQVLEVIDTAIKDIGDKQPRLHGLGTTATIVALPERSAEPRLAVVSVADSRLWLLREGQLSQETIDNTVASMSTESRVQAKRSQEALNGVRGLDDLAKLDPAEQMAFNYRNIVTSPLGTLREKPAARLLDLQPGDRLLLSSDGIHDNLTTAEIAAILSAEEPAEAVSDQLTRAAQIVSRTASVRAKPDDMTAIVIDWKGE